VSEMVFLHCLLFSFFSQLALAPVNVTLLERMRFAVSNRLLLRHASA
jgi:hypothetical protein